MKTRTSWFPSLLILLAVADARPSKAQQMSRIDRETAEVILKQISGDIRKYYYDPKLHNLDWDLTISQAKEAIDKSASINLALAHIAEAVDSLNDSHTFMVPPRRTSRPDYGLTYQMFANRCFVTHVRPHSDAELKGIKSGDEVLLINGEPLVRETLWKIHYKYEVLRPQQRLYLRLRNLSGHEREVEVASTFQQSSIVTPSDLWNERSETESEQRRMRLRYAEFGKDLLVVKFLGFWSSPEEVQTMIDKARQHRALILDLRDDEGGKERTLLALVGGLFDKEVKVADRVRRNGNMPLLAKPLRRVFDGEVTVLVDSNSASASELLARVVQIQQRGAVLGDRSSGAVMEAKDYSYTTGSYSVVRYGASITEANLIMADGKSLEHTGVTPNEVLIPSAEALAKGEDPVLATAASQLGVALDPAAAGKLFPYEWGPE